MKHTLAHENNRTTALQKRTKTQARLKIQAALENEITYPPHP